MSEPAAPVCDLVIISFDDPIEMVKWRMHLVKNWTKHMKENTKLLVLTGVHGHQDGKLGDFDQNFVKSCRGP